MITLQESFMENIKASIKEDIEQVKFRSGQLIELIAFDPQNAKIYQNELIELNIRLVPHILRKYKPFTEDDFQWGCVGLIKAAHSFNPDRCVPFSSYACFCIERELHSAHKERAERFEYIMSGEIESLDALIHMENGDTSEKHEYIPDENAEKQFEALLTEHSLTDLFSRVIVPVIEGIAGSTKGQETVVNFTYWKELELRYILEMSQIDSQKARLTFSSMAKQLGVSVQNIRMRHQRVIDGVKNECIKLGLHI